MDSILNYTHPKSSDLLRILEVWENSVKNTHSFLSEKDIENIKPMVEQGVKQIDALYCYLDKEGIIQAFIGVSQEKVEMLFVNNDVRGKGIGKKLLIFSIQSLGAKYVDVNEQNPKAIGFYEHMGFNIFDRSPLDEQGNPFPILHMRL